MSESAETAKARMWRATRNWTAGLHHYPGWREWQRSRMAYTLDFDDEGMPPRDTAREFEFSEEIDAQHAVVFRYLVLLDTVKSLRDVEWYFRRYPFARTPVTRYDHLTHCCELFFGRFYQFKERLKGLFNAVNRAVPSHGLDVGKFVKLFDKTFEDEMRARNAVHHRERFEDVVLARILLTEVLGPPEVDLRRDLLSHYRRAANTWAARTRRQADRMDAFVEAVADALLRTCPFLDETDHKSTTQ